MKLVSAVDDAYCSQSETLCQAEKYVKMFAIRVYIVGLWKLFVEVTVG